MYNEKTKKWKICLHHATSGQGQRTENDVKGIIN